ncbi:glycosyltransferase family 4 protein [Lacinutrix sp. 5H-3-7-4]|uniref:glycosyltransferase family 4 protein n=1 Tax=Lacinutrix sp. (strain 5H-3-7-4) TaxID=983544 RepID=UPI00020A36B8|nr:glycosyltransferase family 4 protein [Lacinutrix sp. 5H-3-7-4]AEH02208.1 glycosyl transferase group 1 [Lacinutrix sp. 5H-3-7-4]
MKNKKVLIITYYWPPAGGPGVQRWLKFVKYLPEFGVEPIVYCPYNPIYPQVDESLLDEVPENITILKQPIREPYKLANFFSKQSKTISKGIIPENEKQGLLQKAMLYIRGNFFIPDARKGWVKPSFKYLSTYISDFNIDTIVTTGPPHSLHLIGLKLKEKYNDLNWIADFRDPWTTIGYHKQLKLTKASKKKHKILEKAVLNCANQILVTSNNTKKEFEAITNNPITVITNGYDNENIESVPLDKAFTFSHIGSLLSKRNPENLWKIFKELINENEAFKKAFKLVLVGSVSDTILKSIAAYGLTNFLDNVGYVSHKESIKYQKKSQVLLLIEIDSIDTKAIIPGKLFEYMASQRPILAIGPKDTDVERILKSTNSGSYFNYNSDNDLKNEILKHFEAFKHNNLKVNAIGLEQYSRKNLTRELSKVILKPVT